MPQDLSAQHIDRAKELRQIVEETVARWRNGEPVTARAVVDRYPELVLHRSLLYELVSEDFHLRRSAGEMLGPLTYREQFESFGLPIAQSIERVVAIESVFEDATADAMPTEVQWWQPGEEHDQFVVVEELGRGTFSRVYHCLERGLGDRPVAVKVTYQGSPEADRLGRLQHPNIVPILSAHRSSESEATIVVMPLMARYTLADVSAFAHALPETRRADAVRRFLEDSGSGFIAHPRASIIDTSYFNWLLTVARDASSALAYAHSRDVIHCDLKPSNILITPSGTPLLIDFNLSCIQSATRTVFGGTLEYMPPELWEYVFRMPANNEIAMTPSPEMDVFSLAMSLAESLVGRSPIGTNNLPEGSSRAAAAYKAQQHLLSEALSRIGDPCVAGTFEECASKLPARRPKVSDVADVLSKYLDVPPPVPRSDRYSRRRLLAIGAGALAAVAPLGLLATNTLFAGQDGLSDAYNHYSVGQLDKAIPILDTLIEQQPTQLPPRYLRGWVLLTSGQWVRAASDLAFHFHSRNDAHVAGAVGYCYATRGDYDRAFAWYRKAVELKPEREYATLNNLGCCSILGGDTLIHEAGIDTSFGAAIDWFGRASEQDPNAVEPVINQFLYYLEESTRYPGITRDRFEKTPGWLESERSRLVRSNFSHEVELASAVFSLALDWSSPSSIRYAHSRLTSALNSGVYPTLADWDTSPFYEQFRSRPDFSTYRSRLQSPGYSLSWKIAPPTFRDAYLAIVR